MPAGKVLVLLHVDTMAGTILVHHVVDKVLYVLNLLIHIASVIAVNERRCPVLRQCKVKAAHYRYSSYLTDA
jgi:hypothetical protein